MKKIPCLFVREFSPRPGGRGTGFTITSAVTPGLEWVLEGRGVATRKYDGTACMIRDGLLFKRYDVKGGKVAPEGAIPCDAPDDVTGHHPHWVPVMQDDPANRWHVLALVTALSDVGPLFDGTYELCGPHFNGNPEKFEYDTFVRHGSDVTIGADMPRELSFTSLRAYLETAPIEGIVWWRDGEPRCKLRRTDFGFPWGSKGKRA